MSSVWNWLEKANELQNANRKFAIATVTNLRGSTPREIGAKIIIVSESEFYGTVGGGALEAEVIKETLLLLNDKKNNLTAKRFEFKLADLSMVCGGATEVMVEVFNVHPDLYIFGAGHCALALTRVLEGVPFNIHIIDEREEWLNKFSSHINKHKIHFKKFIDSVSFDADSTYIVIMTAGHCDDRDILELVLKHSYKYVGMIGSKSKWATTKNKLIENGTAKENLEKVHCPIGIAIGGKTPAEIAISIAAELISKRFQEPLL